MRRLLIRPGAIGDTILSLPALQYLRTDYTEVWVTTPCVPLIRFADRVRSIASTGLDLVGFQEVRFDPFDEIWSWYGTARPDFREAVRHLPFQFFPALPPVSGMHTTDFYCLQVGAPMGATPRIDCPRENQGFLVIHPFSGSARKNWPLDRFREIAKRSERPVYWIAGPQEPLEEAVRFENLYDLGCFLATAHAYLGNDSGITHLAAAVGTPVTAIFRDSDPAVWKPRGPQVTVVRGHPSVDEILPHLR